MDGSPLMSQQAADFQADHDILVVGGGMAGASLAHALRGSGYRLAVIEAQPPQAPASSSYDERVLALAYGSQRIFDRWGLWPQLESQAQPIEHIHISERGQFGLLRLHATEAGVPALGYVVPARALADPLLGALTHWPEVNLRCPARCLNVQVAPDRVSLTLAEGERTRTVHGRLLVVADGGHSPLRAQLGFPTYDASYAQMAMIANVETAQRHGNWAFERFTDTGPLALLPMTGGRSSLVWTIHPDQADTLMNLPDGDFLALLQRRFGDRLGRFLRVGARQLYPLRLSLARTYYGPRVALLGNAAHLLHPVSGQGFNLGLRDVQVLAEELAQARQRQQDPGAPEVLQRYHQRRTGDQRSTALITDGLARLFVNPLAPVRFARNCGLLALDSCLPGQRWVARRFMGLGLPGPQVLEY